MSRSRRARTTGERRTLRIGVTGPIGCGKSHVAGYLREVGAAIIDADAIARGVTAPGESAHAAVLLHFGSSVTAPDGTLDRAALARMVFADPARLHELEAIVHPAVRPRILAAIEAAEDHGASAVVIEAIKLVEGGLAELCDEVWLVTCDVSVQRERLGIRGTPLEDGERRIAAQAGLAERLRPAATRVIDTSGSMAESQEATLSAFREALAAAG